MNSNTVPASGFAELGIASRLLQALQKRKMHQPTPIQHQSIPIALEGKDILGIAQTGTGKTLAYAIPTLQRMDRFPGTCLVLVPTRELAGQVEETLGHFGRVFNLKTAVLIGGVPIGPQIRNLSQRPRILIATPGRLIDLLEQDRLKLDQVRSLVLDEADRMLDMGFAPQLKRILKIIPKQRQTLLFSATMSPEVLDLATGIMEYPVRIEIAPAGTSVKEIEQEIFIIRREAKFSLLERLLGEFSGRVLVFVRTKRAAAKVTKTLRMLGHRPAEIHSDRSQGQRRSALAGFKSGKNGILVATDIAARGIDVEDVEAVINFDLPDHSEDYVHRIGRTGRAGRYGKAISFATPEQRREIRNIERLIQKKIKVSSSPEENVSDSRPKNPVDTRQDRAGPDRSGAPAPRNRRRRRSQEPNKSFGGKSHGPKRSRKRSGSKETTFRIVSQDKSQRQKNRP